MAWQLNRRQQLWLRARAATTATGMLLGAVFAGWFLAFAVMGVMDVFLLVGMNYLAWPVVFPLMAAVPLWALMFALVPLAQRMGPGGVRGRRFMLAVLLPVTLLTLAVMLLSAPLDTGGTWWSEGAAAFGRED